MPTKEELEQLYDKSWLEPLKKTSETGGTTIRLARLYTQKLARELQIESYEKLKILDFGAGRGAMSESLREMGASVECCEPYGYEYLNRQGFKVHRDLASLSEKKFDGIVMIDVWEHLTEPWTILSLLYGLLPSGGWLYIATANPLGLNARLRGDRWREACKEGHLMFPEPCTLERMLQEVGFSRWKRVKWLIRYSVNPAKIIIHWSMQLLGLDGELRYIAWK